MCNNACVYNLPETIYYKAAKKLLHQGQKLMSAEKIVAMKSTAPFVRHILDSDLGFSFNLAVDEKPVGQLRCHRIIFLFLCIVSRKTVESPDLRLGWPKK